MSSRTIFGICLALALVGCLAVYSIFQTGSDGVRRLDGQDVQYTTSTPATTLPVYTI